jgi:hypothetical protein
MFNDFLKTQLILKNIITPEDWESLSEHIQYDFIYDNHFSDLKNNELLNDQLGVVAAMQPYIGTYFSSQYVRQKVLRQSDSLMQEIDEQIKKEIKDGIIADPATIDPSTGMPFQDNTGGMQNPGGMDLGQPMMEPDLTKQAKSTQINMPKGGEI